MTMCPMKPWVAEMWRHASCAEELGLDEVGCKGRKRSWDKMCEADGYSVRLPEEADDDRTMESQFMGHGERTF